MPNAGEAGRDGLSFDPRWRTYLPQSEGVGPAPVPSPQSPPDPLGRAVPPGWLSRAAGCQQEIPATASPKKTDVGAPGAGASRGPGGAGRGDDGGPDRRGHGHARRRRAGGPRDQGAGRLSEIAVDLGSRVPKGQVIGRIDPSDYQHRLDQAVAALQQARARLGLSPAGTRRPRRPGADGRRPPGPRRARRGQAESASGRPGSGSSSSSPAPSSTRPSSRCRRPRAATRTRSRRSGIARPCSSSGGPRSTSRASSSPTPRSPRRSTAPSASARPPPASTWPRERRWPTLVRIHPLRLRVSVPEREAAA